MKLVVRYSLFAFRYWSLQPNGMRLLRAAKNSQRRIANDRRLTT
jgi:hypothetical protein